MFPRNMYLSLSRVDSGAEYHFNELLFDEEHKLLRDSVAMRLSYSWYDAHGGEYEDWMEGYYTYDEQRHVLVRISDEEVVALRDWGLFDMYQSRKFRLQGRTPTSSFCMYTELTAVGDQFYMAGGSKRQIRRLASALTIELTPIILRKAWEGTMELDYVAMHSADLGFFIYDSENRKLTPLSKEEVGLLRALEMTA